MKLKLFLTGLVLLAWLSPVFAGSGGISTAVSDQYKQVKESVEKLEQTKVGKYAKDMIEPAGKRVLEAREAMDSGDEKKTKEALDMASMQIALAYAVADEREAAEKTAIEKAELEKLEQRITDMLTVKGDAK